MGTRAMSRHEQQKDGVKIKFAQKNDLKHILVLKVLKPDNFFFKMEDCNATSGCEWVQWCKHAQGYEQVSPGMSKGIKIH